jgi:hypothetical protein
VINAPTEDLRIFQDLEMTLGIELLPPGVKRGERGIELIPLRVKILDFDARRYNWVRVFWLKVIIRAMFDYALWKDSKEIGHRRCAEEAQRWLFEQSKMNNSLANLCEFLDVSIHDVRRVARQLTPEQVKRMEHIEHNKLLTNMKEGEEDGEGE